MFLEIAKVVKHIHFVIEDAEAFHLLILNAPKIASCAKPGQFLMVKISNNFDPLLRRPFSIFFCEKEKIAILYKVVGKGTKLMTYWKEGDNVNILGPLGNGFKVYSLSSIWLLAGGAGIAPLFFLAKVLKKKKANFKFIWGLRYKVHSELLAFLKENFDITIYTEDGSLGYQGLIMDGVKKFFDKKKPNFIYACGPLPMLKALAIWNKDKKIPMQISLETNMACGIGACLGCVISTKAGYCKVCQDGPIFDVEEIIWK